MPPKKKSDDLLAAIQAAAEADAAAADDPPDTVEIGGVTYYRQPPTPGPRKPDREGFEFITINVAPHSREIRIDNVVYSHGFTYEIEAKRVPTFHEIMHRTWQHERSTGGANINAGGYSPQGRHIDGQGGIHIGAHA